MIDAHAHVFPDRATGEAWQTVVGFEPVRPGTVEDLTARMDRAGIERTVALLFPRSAQREQALRAEAGGESDESEIRTRVADEIRAYNRWGCDLAARDHHFVAFVGVNARYLTGDEIEAEIRAGAAAGARGVKIILPPMRLYPDDPLLEPVYATCVELGLPLLSQSGTSGMAPVGPVGPYGRPALFAPVLERFPALRLVLAHLGHGYEHELFDLTRHHDAVVTDTSLQLGSPREQAPWDPAPLAALIRRIGTERVLFGTNYPIADPVEYVRRFGTLGLGTSEAELVGMLNARRLLGD